MSFWTEDPQVKELMEIAQQRMELEEKMRKTGDSLRTKIGIYIRDAKRKGREFNEADLLKLQEEFLTLCTKLSNTPQERLAINFKIESVLRRMTVSMLNMGAFDDPSTPRPFKIELPPQNPEPPPANAAATSATKLAVPSPSDPTAPPPPAPLDNNRSASPAPGSAAASTATSSKSLSFIHDANRAVASPKRPGFVPAINIPPNPNTIVATQPKPAAAVESVSASSSASSIAVTDSASSIASSSTAGTISADPSTSSVTETPAAAAQAPPSSQSVETTQNSSETRKDQSSASPSETTNSTPSPQQPPAQTETKSPSNADSSSAPAASSADQSSTEEKKQSDANTSAVPSSSTAGDTPEAQPASSSTAPPKESTTTAATEEKKENVAAPPPAVVVVDEHQQTKSDDPKKSEDDKRPETAPVGEQETKKPVVDVSTTETKRAESPLAVSSEASLASPSGGSMLLIPGKESPTTGHARSQSMPALPAGLEAAVGGGMKKPREKKPRAKITWADD